MLITAAVTDRSEAPPALRELELGEPGPHEVLVRIAACGICHTDWSAPAFCRLPAVFGHEGAGVVEAVGRHVTALRPGDRVALTFGSCGICRACDEGEPAYCHDLQRLQFGGERADGSPSYAARDGQLVHGAFFQQSSFATHALATERNTVKIPDEMPLELAGIFGCGVQTGAGAVFNTLAVRPLTSIAVFGAGTVGLSAIMAARIAGCGEIIAVDVVTRRLDLASELGATRTIDAREGDPALQVREFTRGGAMYSLETAGAIESFNAAIECLAFRGVCGIVTVPNHGQPFAFTPLPILFGRRLVGVLEGSSVPQQFIPRLMRLHLEGRLPVERLVSFYDFEQVGSAFADAQAGRVLKPILTMRG